MLRKKAARPRAARKKLDFDELVAPELRELLPIEWRAAKPGQRALVLMRWADPVDPDAELVNAAINIIRPPKEKEASCRAQVAQTIRIIRMMENEERAGALMLQKLRHASLKTAKLLAELPVTLQHRLLRSRDYPIIRIAATAKPEVTAPARCERLRIELNSLARISPLCSPTCAPDQNLIGSNSTSPKARTTHSCNSPRYYRPKPLLGHSMNSLRFTTKQRRAGGTSVWSASAEGL